MNMLICTFSETIKLYLISPSKIEDVLHCLLFRAASLDRACCVDVTVALGLYLYHSSLLHQLTELLPTGANISSSRPKNQFGYVILHGY